MPEPPDWKAIAHEIEERCHNYHKEADQQGFMQISLYNAAKAAAMREFLSKADPDYTTPEDRWP